MHEENGRGSATLPEFRQAIDGARSSRCSSDRPMPLRDPRPIDYY
jgi:hypothetical protein